MTLHVANIDFPELYAGAVGSLEAAHSFYDSVSHTGTEAGRTAKIILHQAGRMVWLADQIDLVSRGRPALQIMFFMIAAEAVAKLAAGYEGEGESRAHVRQFFTKYCTALQRQRIHRALEWATPPPPVSPDEMADYLYDIRCDVVHRGQYFLMTVEDAACVREVRAVILEGAVQAAREKATPIEEGRS